MSGPPRSSDKDNAQPNHLFTNPTHLACARCRLGQFSRENTSMLSVLCTAHYAANGKLPSRIHLTDVIEILLVGHYSL
jgi:hypothetical protein